MIKQSVETNTARVTDYYAGYQWEGPTHMDSPSD